MTAALRTAADLLRTLNAGTYTLPELYALAESAGIADRPGNRDRIQDGQERYKRQVRSALYAARDAARIRRVEAGSAAWLIEGTPEHPRRALFVWLPADPSALELVLGSAADVLAESDEPYDLVFADPPWALGRDRSDAGYRRTYGRDHHAVMPGYADVDPAAYADFTAEWVTVAAKALRPGGYLAVVTGAQQAARVQISAEDAGLTYVNSIAVQRQFGLYSTRRYVHSHHTVTLMTAGALDNPRRTFHRPQDMPRGAAGEVYAVDVWNDIADERRPGQLRYDNALPVKLADRVIRSTTNEGGYVADPFNGSGTTGVACLLSGRRYRGSDVNPESLRFTMGRILAEVVPAMQAARPTLDTRPGRQLAMF